MKKYALIIFAFLLAAGFGFARPAGALEIPSYIHDVDDIQANIDAIIDSLTSKSVGITGAIDDAELQNIMLRKLSAALYAEALTTRTKLLKEAKDKAKAKTKNKLMGAIKDKKAVLTDEVQPHLRSIAERLNSIVSLEAAIANLEGTTILTTMPKVNSAVGPGSEDEGE